MAVLGLDIGGANLKAAHTAGPAASRPFALWKQPDQLAEQLRSLIEPIPAFDRLAITMTGEQCDCFATHREGVLAILGAVRALARPEPIVCWHRSGHFVSLEEGVADPLPLAAGNWHALATFAGRFVPRGTGLMIDVGSTTADIVPLRDGRVTIPGHSDTQRLAAGQLVYTGATRTPLCALLGAAGAAEWFATTHDVYLMLGLLPDEPERTDTADSRPATRTFAHARLARMLCGDAESIPEEQALALAEKLQMRQRGILALAAAKVAHTLGDSIGTVVIAGAGEFIARGVATLSFPEARLVALADQLGPERSSAACAYAVAVLAEELGQ